MNISYSALQQFLTCSQAFVLEKVERKKKLDRNTQNKDGILKHFILAEKISKSFGIPFLGTMPKATFNEFELARMYLDHFDHDIIIGNKAVLGIELNHSIPFKEDVNIETCLDLVLKDQASNAIEVIDWKMGRIVSDPEDDDQGAFYAWSIMNKYGVDEVKFTKYFVHYRDSHSKTYIRSEIERFMSYIDEISKLMQELYLNPSDAITCVSSKCATCRVQHFCSAGQDVKSDPEEITESIEFHKTRIKDLEENLREIAAESDGKIDLVDGSSWEFKASKSVALKKGKLSKSELCGKLIKDFPNDVIESEGLDIKLDTNLVEKAKTTYNANFIIKTTNRFNFKKSN